MNGLEMLHSILEQPAATTHPCMRITSLKLIGDLYMWISHHRENWLERSVQFLISGMSEQGPCQKDFQLVGAESLKSLCTSCRGELAKHYNPLIIAADELLDRLVWKAAHNLLTGISYVVSECKFLSTLVPFAVNPVSIVPVDIQEKCISHLVGRQAGIVTQCIADDGQPHLALDRISTLFRYLKAPPGKLPHTQTVEEMLPVLSDSLCKWQRNPVLNIILIIN